jgi:small-conductance mechanosensitive channel
VLGLALQNTLSDVFSGIAVDIEAPFQVGDRVSLGNNIEGQVVEMNWRSIRIQTDGADIAIVPNSVVAKLQIVNRSVPNRDRAVSVQLLCPARADPDRVVEVLQENIAVSVHLGNSGAERGADPDGSARPNALTLTLRPDFTALVGKNDSGKAGSSMRRSVRPRLSRPL